jgi:N-acetyl-anhydromuramyl-L-alanine amidase AmpD
MIQIDELTYKVKEINRHKTQSPKTQIVLASSLRKDSNHIIRLLHKEFGKTKKWNTYTISRDGVIYNHYDPKLHSDFLGIKEGDKQSISIVLENMGSLIETENGNYVNTLNEVCDENNVKEKNLLGYNYWEQFTDEQIISTVKLCKKLSEQFGIPKTLIEFHHYHKDIIKYRGIVFRGNYIEESSDINPLFDIGKFNEMLHNEFI